MIRHISLQVPLEKTDVAGREEIFNTNFEANLMLFYQKI